MTRCILCGRETVATTASFLFLHEEAEDCLVRVTDNYGVSLDDKFEVQGEDIFYRHTPEEEAERIVEVSTFLTIENACKQIFDEVGLDRLGGQSTGSGWSNVSLFQRCPYAWKRRYVEPLKIENFGIEVEQPALAIGILIHTLLAVYYTRMIVHDYPLTPETVNQRVRELGCNPDLYAEAWRLFTGYRLYYKNETLQPLAIEYNLVDPRTNHSCRYDLVAYLPEERPGMLPGTYVIEHKSAARFSADTLEGWINDGEVLGQVDLWQRLHLEKRFGPLRGVLVNLLGKQKTPEFHRTLVSPTAFTVEDHRRDLRNWNAKITHARAIDDFPRSRNNCIGRYGRCQLFDHCARQE